VLLAAANGTPWIREQMESILAQSGVDLRIAIRDDASTDGTHRELDRFRGDKRVKIDTATVASGSAARNFLNLIAANPAAAFDLVAFADQDDVWHSDKLYRASQMLIATNSAGYSSATLAVWESGRELIVKPSGPPTSSDFLFEGAGQGCTFVLTSAFYERVRHFITKHRGLADHVHYHDWLIYALARSWGLHWSFDTRPSMRYRQHEHNDTGARGTLAGLLKRAALIRRGWYRDQLHAIAAACAAAAPANTAVRAWHGQLSRARSWERRMQITRFCMRGGRRRTRDKVIAILAALAGWI
jgi:rhamnosyltransferase